MFQTLQLEKEIYGQLAMAWCQMFENRKLRQILFPRCRVILDPPMKKINPLQRMVAEKVSFLIQFATWIRFRQGRMLVNTGKDH